MGDYTQSEFRITVPEEDLPVYMRVYRALKDNFASPDTRLFISHTEEDIYEVLVVGLYSRDTLEFCANVFAELPSKTVKLVEEAQRPISEAAELGNSIPFETYDDNDVEETEDSEEESEYEEEEEEDTTNADGETPSEEVQRKLKKPVLVRKTSNAAVTIETD